MSPQVLGAVRDGVVALLFGRCCSVWCVLLFGIVFGLWDPQAMDCGIGVVSTWMAWGVSTRLDRSPYKALDRLVSTPLRGYKGIGLADDSIGL